VVAFVHGALGLGKSYLLRRFMRRLKRRSRGRSCSRADARGGRGAYKALDSLMADLGDYLDHLPPAKAALLLPRDIQCWPGCFRCCSRWR